MCIKAINQAFNTKLSGNVKLVLLALADCADENMQCFPSYSHIAKKASISTITAKRIVKKLEDMQALKKQNRFNKNKTKSSNIYTLNINSINMIPLKKVIDDTSLISQETPLSSIIAVTHKSPYSLTTSYSSKESERDFLNFKNALVKKFEGKIFAALDCNYIYSIDNGLLCINKQKINTQKAFEEWQYLYLNQNLINPNLNSNIYYLNVGKNIEIDDELAKIIDIKDDFYVIEINKQKKLVKINEVSI